ncbi:RHS repeat-associated core domain-containing protein [Delftia tsuruhatensis]|uniref:RHS repeat-associated core domain-containing protein n=1 Tax=Delftia tsuruhatensis TaxID=180282 RepID=UPI001F19038C|nr:RHS repeat-associated core domain-containing protein [Delftia tsuruhatensis]
MAWQWLISGFGEVRPTTGERGYGQTVSGPSYAEVVKFDLRYPGQVFDEETGLSYNLHRYYDAATGRYVQADPIGLAGGWNRFGYVGGDPLNAIDPDGLNAVVALNRIAELGRGLYYRYGPAITEFIAGASGVNGAVASPAAINPLVAQIPTGVSRMAPIARGIAEGVESGAFCSAQQTSKIDGVIAETLGGRGNITSGFTLSADELLSAGQRFFGKNYVEIGKPGSGVFRSIDGTRQFRIDGNSLLGNHAPGLPHGHLELYAPKGNRPISNNHIIFGN